MGEDMIRAAWPWVQWPMCLLKRDDAPGAGQMSYWGLAMEPRDTLGRAMTVTHTEVTSGLKCLLH